MCIIFSLMKRWAYELMKPFRSISIESLYYTILSYIPWRITDGHLTPFTTSILLKRSSRRKSAILPHSWRAIWVTDLIGLIKIKQRGLYFAAKWQAGPEPIDLPLMIISWWLIFKYLLTKLKTISASNRIC